MPPKNVENDTDTAPASDITKAEVAAVRDANDESTLVSYTCGTCAIPRAEYKLYYSESKGDSAPVHSIDLAAANVSQLRDLSAACEPAPFGLNGENVFDEHYRLARKMDTTQFSMPFDVYCSGLIQVVETELVKNSTDSPNSYIVPELYMLNIYETGGFFKAHVDTPRAANMFGTLVIVFPTMHQGGQLVLRHNDKEWSYDSAAVVSPVEGVEPKIAYIAFYGDVEHEVLPVTAGYRLTLTYNLYLDNKLPDLHIDRPLLDAEKKVQASVAQLMADIGTTLPKGGYLGFELSFKYPVELGVDVRSFKDGLKGRDALIMRVCEKLDLEASVLAFYWLEDEADAAPAWVGVSSHALDLTASDLNYTEDYAYDHSLGVLGYLVDNGRCSILRMRGVSRKDELGDEIENERPCEDLVWVTDMSSKKTNLKSGYIQYGYRTYMMHMYGDLAIFVKVPPSSSMPSLSQQ